MMEAVQKMTRLSSLFALIFSVLISVFPPAGYFFLSYEHQKAVLEAEAHMNSVFISQIITAAPEHWRYEQLRIGEVLSAHSSGEYDEMRRVIDNNNAVIAASGGGLYPPIIRISHDLFDAGIPVARIEIQGSLRSFLEKTALIGIFSTLSGIVIFAALRIFPLRALSITMQSIHDEKEKAREAEKSLQSLTLRYEAILTAVPDIIMEVDNKKVYTWANKAGYEFFGNDVLGKEAAYFFEGEQQTYNMVQPLFNGGEDIVYVKSWQRRKDGEKRLLAWWCRVLKDSEGNVSGALSTARDITEHKRTEDERSAMLRRKEEVNALQLSLLTPATLDQKLKSITDGIIRIFEADFCRIWLIRPGDLCGEGCIHAEVREGPHICRFRDRCLHLLASSGRYTHTDGKVHCRVPFGCYKIGLIASGKEHKLLTNDVQNDLRVHNREWARELGLVSFAGYQLRVPDGQIIGVLALFARHPISDDEDAILDGLSSTTAILIKQAAAEEALKKSEEFNRSILETVDEGFIVVDPEFRIISANKAYLKMINKSEENVIGGHCYELSHRLLKPCCEAGEDCAVSRTLKTGEPQTTTHTHHDDAGNPIFVDIKSYPIRDGSGKIVAAIEVINNITEHKKLEDQLRHAQKMEAVGTLAGGIAHDFNNILNIIIGYGTMALNRLENDPLSREQINEVLAAADRAASLIKRLLTFSRREAVEKKPVNINETILDMEKMLSRIIGEDITFSMELAERKMIVMADSGQMEQVLMNLISNARDAMPKGGKLTISTGIKEVNDDFVAAYGYGRRGAYALISVTDTGCGVDAETVKKIFDPFFTTKGVGKGTGLGLAIAYGIIKQHDGYIQVYSEAGKGTTFKILLPIVEGEAAEVREAEAAAPVKGGTETILVAEDDAAVRSLLRIILESFGYTVITAEDGEDAITKYRENMDSIQLLVLDMIMPKKNGKEAYAEIKNISPDIKAIFVSGYTMDIIHQKELLDDVMDFILKPVSPKDLLKKVREALDR